MYQITATADGRTYLIARWVHHANGAAESQITAQHLHHHQRKHRAGNDGAAARHLNFAAVVQRLERSTGFGRQVQAGDDGVDADAHETRARRVGLADL